MELSVIKPNQPTDDSNVDNDDSSCAESEELTSRLFTVYERHGLQVDNEPTSTANSAASSARSCCPFCSPAAAHYCLSVAERLRYCTCRTLSVCRGMGITNSNRRGGPRSSRGRGGIGVMAVGRKTSWTTFNVAIIFVLSLLFFLLSLSGNYPYLSNGKIFNNWNRNRMSRDNDLFSNDMTILGKSGDYSRLRNSSLNGIAFQFTSKIYDPGVEPFKDCRMKQAKKFARKRQIVLPNREKFSIKPKFQNTEDIQTSKEDGLESSWSNELKVLLVITYDTSYSLRQKLRNWALNFSEAATSSVDVEIDIIFVVTHSDSDEDDFDEILKEARKWNDILVPSLSGYPIISTLAYLTSGTGGQMDSSHSKYSFLTFLSKENYTIGTHLISLLQFIYLDHSIQQQNSQIDSIDYYLQDLNVFGGLQCLDYEDSRQGRDQTSYSCNTDAFFCAATNSLLFMSTSLAFSLSDASWGQVPLLSDESRFLGYALEVADIEYRAIILQKYIVNGKNHASSGKLRQNGTLVPFVEILP